MRFRGRGASEGNRTRALTYGNVVSTLALFIALGGVSYAVTQIDPNSVRSEHVVDRQIKARDLGTSAVTSLKIKDGTIGRQDFKPSANLPRVFKSELETEEGVPLNSTQAEILADVTLAPGEYLAQGLVQLEMVGGSQRPGQAFCRMFGIREGADPVPVSDLGSHRFEQNADAVGAAQISVARPFRVGDAGPLTVELWCDSSGTASGQVLVTWAKLIATEVSFER